MKNLLQVIHESKAIPFNIDNMLNDYKLISGEVKNANKQPYCAWFIDISTAKKIMREDPLTNIGYSDELDCYMLFVYNDTYKQIWLNEIPTTVK